MHHDRSLRFLLVLLAVLPWASASSLTAAEEPPVVVAVDTSRSLDRAALGEVVDRLRLALSSLDPTTPTGLLGFDDEPRWLVRPTQGPQAVADALRELTLQGNYTLLNDALFVAARELPEGGVILLATDGRDENSATTVDDIARRCEAQGVRILAVGTGQNVAVRFLRRLALLSNGSYLGEVTSVDASEVASAIKVARSEVQDETAGQRAGQAAAIDALARQRGGQGSGAPGPNSPQTGPASATPAPAISNPGTSGPLPITMPSWIPWAGGLAAALLLLLVWWLMRRGKSTDPSTATDEHLVRDQEQTFADEAEAEMMRLELVQATPADLQEAPEVTVDTAVFQQMSLDERLDRTRVLSDHAVLLMRKQGEAPRTFMLDRDKAFAVGRDSQRNTLSVPDPALSSQHFKIVPKDDNYYFVDLDSTNGSFIGGRKVSAKRLRSGEMIRAGQVEFEFQSYDL